jgi:hypothetical protein
MVIVKKTLFIIFLCLALSLRAQVNIKDSIINCSFTGLSLGMDLPGGNLSKRFGYNSHIAFSYFYKTKTNWLFAFDVGYIFGSKIKENGILDSIKTSTGNIINKNGEFAEVRLFERGWVSTIRGGKLFPVIGPNKNCGIFVMVGGGVLQHRIRIDDIGNNSLQLRKEYKKGYDRLTNGFALSQSVGYLHLGNKRFVNFFALFEFTQGFTQSRRSWDYDLMRRDTEKRIDLLNGFRFGWILPLYKKTPDEFYYY